MKKNKRWLKTSNLSAKWDSRTIKIASLIEPNSNIIEFGAGRLVLSKHLPDNCVYTPSDLDDRGMNTLVWDLNDKTLPDLDEAYDTAVFSGVLEYINDVPRLIKHLSNINTIIISYATTPLNVRNASNQWVNSYTNEDILKIFGSNGYGCVEVDTWRKQTIYKFVK